MKYTFRDLMEKSWSDGLAEGEAKGKAEGVREGKIEAKNEMLETFRRLGVSEEIINKTVAIDKANAII